MENRSLQRGKFISFEGSEGCGKSTQIRRFVDWLRTGGREVLVTREPGGTAAGEKIRHLLQHDPDGEALTPESECSSSPRAAPNSSARSSSRPRPRGVWVVADRFLDSTTVYQGAGRGLDLGAVQRINAFAVGPALPDLTFLLDLDAATGHARAVAASGYQHDRIESQPLAFFETVRRAYLELAAAEPARIAVIDASKGNRRGLRRPCPRVRGSFRHLPRMSFRYERARELIERSAEKGRLAHAYLLMGPTGSGKERLAMHMIGLANPEERLLPPESLEDLRSGFVSIVSPESKTRKITVDAIRAVEHTLHMAAPAGVTKFAVIRDADRMGDSASNAFLKTLEEPPPSSRVLLLTSRPEMLLETILSRCIRVPLAGSVVPETIGEGTARLSRPPRGAGRQEAGRRLDRAPPHGGVFGAVEIGKESIEEANRKPPAPRSAFTRTPPTAPT